MGKEEINKLKKKYTPNTFEVKCYDGNLFMLSVGFIRPHNAPRYRFTKADIARQRVSAYVNLEIICNQPYKSFAEVLNVLKELGFSGLSNSKVEE